MKNKLPLLRMGKFYLLIIILVFAILLSAVYSISVGQVYIPFNQSINVLLSIISNNLIGTTDNIDNVSLITIIYQVRMPRVIFALLVGLGLSLCGVVMQAVVQNPLADPYILGVSSGATLGATFSILIGFGSSAILSQFGVAFGAFIGAFITAIAVLILSSLGGKVTSIKLVLSGVVIGALCSSFSNLIIYFASNAEGIKSVTFWSMGSLASASWDKIPIIIFVVVIGIIFFLSQFRVLNAMLLGDESAITLGINLGVFRKIYMIVVALITGTLVAYTGMIGFVGLIIPHLVRGITGSDHKNLLPFALLLGALFMIWADILSRVLIDNVELPIGIITAVIGSPLFIYIIIKKGYNFGG